jgi:protein-S-isoprenylcysteine O-methyltransferase Ste14
MTGPLLTFLAFSAYAIIHSLLASLRAKQEANTRFGTRSEQGYRLVYNLFSSITLIPVLVIPAIFPGETLYRLRGLWIVGSTSLQVLGALVILVGMIQTDIWHFLGIRQLFGNQSGEHVQMVTHGLYRYMRHPLYTGGLLFIWFIPWMTTSLLAYNIAATLYLYVGSIFEERRLIIEFGETYRQYQMSVGRFFPKFSSSARKPRHLA